MRRIYWNWLRKQKQPIFKRTAPFASRQVPHYRRVNEQNAHTRIFVMCITRPSQRETDHPDIHTYIEDEKALIASGLAFIFGQASGTFSQLSEHSHVVYDNFRVNSHRPQTGTLHGGLMRHIPTIYFAFHQAAWVAEAEVHLAIYIYIYIHIWSEWSMCSAKYSEHICADNRTYALSSWSGYEEESCEM